MLAVIAAMTLALAVPGPAGANAQGAAVFNCKVNLPVWPTLAGPPVDCFGKITGVIQGKTTAGAAYRLLPTNNAFQAHANTYREVCTGGEPINGSANGRISAVVKSATPAGVASINNINFVWTRIGATAVVNMSGGTIALPNGQIATGNKASSVAAFAPSKLGTCAKPAINMTATIAGVTAFQS
jgi:hypothetical protein